MNNNTKAGRNHVHRGITFEPLEFRHGIPALSGKIGLRNRAERLTADQTCRRGVTVTPRTAELWNISLQYTFTRARIASTLRWTRISYISTESVGIADMRRMRPAMPQVSDDRPPTYVFIARTFHASLYMIPIFSITLQAVGQAGRGGIEYQPHICSLDNGPRAPLLPLSREFPKFFDVYKGEGGSISFV